MMQWNDKTITLVRPEGANQATGDFEISNDASSVQAEIEYRGWGMTTVEVVGGGKKVVEEVGGGKKVVKPRGWSW